MSKEKEITNETVTELITAGVIVGHKRSKTHPRMKPFIAMNRNEIEFLDPESSLQSIDDAVRFLSNRLGPDDIMLCTGTTAPVKELVKTFAEMHKYPYVITRWLGGTLTNFKAINDRVKYYVDLKAKKEKGELDKYTKKEQLKFSEEIVKMARSFDGLLTLTRLPAVLFVVDAKASETAVKEANKLGIPIVAIIDTDDNPKDITNPIFANDHAKQSVEWVLKCLNEGLRAAQKSKE
ncbi:MAG: 30S ribosomal protein S2 [Candidatus Paceibacterota bacterium]|jgi:small subunit ribosomal protein S2